MATGVSIIAVPDSVVQVKRSTSSAGSTQYTVPANRFAVVTVSLHGVTTAASYFKVNGAEVLERIISGGEPKQPLQGSFTVPPETLLSIDDDVGVMLVELYLLPGATS